MSSDMQYPLLVISFTFFSTDTATTEIYTLSLHDALPIYRSRPRRRARRRDRTSGRARLRCCPARGGSAAPPPERRWRRRDRKSTRLNSSHVAISYAVFCLKKKTNK